MRAGSSSGARSATAACWAIGTGGPSGLIPTRLPEQDCRPLTAQDLPELDHHGEYVAAARLTGWGSAGLTVLSVHAQPSSTSDDYLSHYPEPDRIGRRDGGKDPRHAGRRFDADVVLETVRRCGPDVLACGDLNEARGWDDAPGHQGQTWGRSSSAAGPPAVTLRAALSRPPAWSRSRSAATTARWRPAARTGTPAISLITCWPARRSLRRWSTCRSTRRGCSRGPTPTGCWTTRRSGSPSLTLTLLLRPSIASGSRSTGPGRGNWGG